MQRIPKIKEPEIPEESAALLKRAEEKYGKCPNLFTTLAHSAAALRSVLELSDSLERSHLTELEREAVQLYISEKSESVYCLAAHTERARNLGAKTSQTLMWRAGYDANGRMQALLDLGKLLAEKHGRITDHEFEQARAAGLSYGEILDTAACVIDALATNLLNGLCLTDVDFPPPPAMT